ncbi:class II glutamine amidotransferase [Phycicoccus duodecadis]|uniref:Putative glutamine amidotransferase n=1 Tax=Phycicoccus duodecadis TaxID=173053 RepID=A0A2N3YIZ0_9MICO|nr:class II glutamine amidotransferase [Phycicoccus duodecadis]PKW26817.1 putative glutamine amidotransferase [Phycicoccus duodecadis]
MCRLLAYASATPRTLAEMLGPEGLIQFTELSTRHADGWGNARAQGDRIVTEVEPAAARSSGRFAQLASSEATDLSLLHLRWATLGLPVAPQNTHPFTDGSVAFAHNGSVSPPSALEALISDRWKPLLRGDTDSERYFLALMSRLHGVEPTPESVATAYAELLTDIMTSFTYTSLNSMLITPDHLIVACAFDEAAEAKDEEPEYFRLRYRVQEDHVLVSSSGWGTGWNTLPNGHVLVVERGSLRTYEHALRAPSTRT